MTPDNPPDAPAALPLTYEPVAQMPPWLHALKVLGWFLIVFGACHVSGNLASIVGWNSPRSMRWLWIIPQCAFYSMLAVIGLLLLWPRSAFSPWVSIALVVTGIWLIVYCALVTLFFSSPPGLDLSSLWQAVSSVMHMIGNVALLGLIRVVRQRARQTVGLQFLARP